MRRALTMIALASALALGGCQDFRNIETFLSNAAGALGKTKVDSKSAYIAINVFNAAERSVKNFLILPLCDGTVPICRPAGAAAALEQPFQAGIIARNDLRAFMRQHPGTLADAGMYTTLVDTTATLKKVMAIYHIGG